jgi:hypothetical protein
MSTAAESEPKTTTAPPASASPLDAHAAPVSDTRKQSGKATAALVLGILGTLTGFVIPAVGLVLGILGIVFGRQARWHDPKSGWRRPGSSSASSRCSCRSRS